MWMLRVKAAREKGNITMTYKTMNGSLYRALLDFGIRNLAFHSEEVNGLNIFPVPDGDTGTNMVTTMRLGYRAIAEMDGDLPTLAKCFAGAVVYGARGNSGVIVSQFLRGFSEVFAHLGTSSDEASPDEEFHSAQEHEISADCKCVIRALEHGVALAYRAVSHPTEGTILTVVREATEAIKANADRYDDLGTLIGDFLIRARESLENTPNLLPVLKSAGVVDSGGVGIVYVFEGMYRYLTNGSEPPAELAQELPDVREATEPMTDYSRYGRSSEFRYGYCTECLLQLLDGKARFHYNTFREKLCTLGQSVVTSYEEEGGKVKLHVHTDTPEAVLSYVHSFGEFLTLKIENMTVQHSEANAPVIRKSDKRSGAFAVVAVASSKKIADLFLEMGADVILSIEEEYSPSTQDFLEAYSFTENRRILVFPNNSNLLLAARQARDLCENARVTVVGSRSIADCYAALAMLNYESEDVGAVVETAESILENVYAVRIARAIKDANYGALCIKTGDVVAMSGNEVILAGNTVLEVARAVIDGEMQRCERDTVTLFTGVNLHEAEAEAILSHVKRHYIFTETDCVETDSVLYDLILSFE